MKLNSFTSGNTVQRLVWYPTHIPKVHHWASKIWQKIPNVAHSNGKILQTKMPASIQKYTQLPSHLHPERLLIQNHSFSLGGGGWNEARFLSVFFRSPSSEVDVNILCAHYRRIRMKFEFQKRALNGCVIFLRLVSLGVAFHTWTPSQSVAFSVFRAIVRPTSSSKQLFGIRVASFSVHFFVFWWLWKKKILKFSNQ